MGDDVFHRLRVSEVIPETHDSCSLVFELSPEQAAHFDYEPGQFLTLRASGTDSGFPARCYSLASSPHADQHLKVVVKRVDGGYGSNWICDNATAGTEFDVLSPAGKFTPRTLDQDLLMFAGGSGITPIMSILKSVLRGGTGSVVLCYANRDEHSVIFGNELARLAAEHPGRLVVVHWLESAHGLPDVSSLRALARPYADREVFLCGPKPFMQAAREALRQEGTPRAKVHMEHFISLAGDPFHATEPTGASQDERAVVEVLLDGQEHTFDWPCDTKLLDLLRQHGMNAPSSCSEGVCASCECQVLQGEVRMVQNHVLDEEDISDGYVLACQALPVTARVRITYSS